MCISRLGHRIKTDNLSFRALALYFFIFQTEKYWFDTQSISKELEEWREGQI